MTRHIPADDSAFYPMFMTWRNLASSEPDLSGCKGFADTQAAEDRHSASLREAEAWLLSHPPTSAAEAICVLEVVLENQDVYGPARQAMVGLQDWLAQGLLSDAFVADDEDPVDTALASWARSAGSLTPPLGNGTAR